MKRASWAVFFLIGMLVGAAAGRWAGGHRRPPPPPDPDEVLARVSRDLDLDDAQRAKAREIFVDEQKRMDALHARTRRDFEAVRLDIQTRLSALLTPAQKERFDAQRARWDRFHKEGFPDEPPPPPPPDR